MSAEAVGWTWSNSPYKGAALVVHLAIADVANDAHDNEFFMTMPSLAVKCRSTDDTVRAACKKMVDEGYLEVVRKSNGGRNRPTVFRFIMKPPENSGVKIPTPENTGLSEEETPEFDGLNPREIRGALNSSNSIVTTNSKGEIDSDFKTFWALYPKKVGKVNAANAFGKAVERVPPAEILDGLRRLLPSITANEPQFIKHPATWLNAGCWEDEAVMPTTSSPLKGNAQLGKDYYNFEHDGSNESILKGLGADVVRLSDYE